MKTGLTIRQSQCRQSGIAYLERSAKSMRVFGEYFKCVAFVALVWIAFKVIWAFLGTALSYLGWAIVYDGYAQSKVHLLAVDSFDLIENEPIAASWSLLGLAFFSWVVHKRAREKVRKIGLAVFLAPYVALTILFLVAALVQERAELSDSKDAWRYQLNQGTKGQTRR